MNLKEAAAYFGVSYWSIRGLIAKGFIDAKPWIRNGFLDRCTEKQRSARYVDLNRRALLVNARGAQCRILYLKPRGLLILATTRARIFEESA